MTTRQRTIAAHEAWFRQYVQALLTQETAAPSPMTLKLEHTFAVLAHARRIAKAALPERLHRSAALAALYHDLARFEQYLRWHTFRDNVSVNHGLFGAQLLQRLHCLEGETRETRILVRAAVALHNRYAIPAAVPEDVRLVTSVVRDADKLDILRVMDIYFSSPQKDATVVLSVKDEPDSFTPAVVEAALEGRLAFYTQLRYENDFRVMLGSWVYDLNFPMSRRIMAQEGHLRRIVEGLPPLPLLLTARDKLLQGIATYMTEAD